MKNKDFGKWFCSAEDRQEIIEFALALEDNEEIMGEQAAMQVTCEERGLTHEQGYDYLTCLPNSPYPWWADDNRLSPHEREKVIKEHAKI